MTAYATSTRTEVAIVGGGPAGLMLSRLLHLAGIESVIVDNRDVREIETTHRAGILEGGAVDLLVETGADRVLTDGYEHQGIDLRFGGESHRIDFQALVGASVWLYSQTEVFIDLHRLRSKDGADLRYGIRESAVFDVVDKPRVEYVDADGATHQILADLVVGADGSRSICRQLIEGRQQYFREYPFAWFGIMVEAPISSPELIYSLAPEGFALISQRNPNLQRMYFQCDPGEDALTWSDERIWETLQTRLAGPDGFTLNEGPIIERTVLQFRSFVQSPMRHAKLLLAGDAAHTVPPTGAKGLNLAFADVRVLAEVIERALRKHDHAAFDEYTGRALDRVWRSQHFSYLMTRLLHRPDDQSEFDRLRQLAELNAMVGSTAGSTYLAEGYTGWPTPRSVT